MPGLLFRFRTDASGQIAIIFALSSSLIVAGIGSGIDLSRAYAARQKLSGVAALTCQYSTRPSVVAVANNTSGAAGGFATYVAAVNGFATASLASQHWTGSAPTPTAPATTFFTATPAGTGTSTAGATAPTNPVVELSASVPTLFMQLFHVTQVTVHAKVKCLTAAATPFHDTSTGPGNTTSFALQEGFETGCASGFCFIRPDGTIGIQASPSSATTATPGYTGNQGQQWYILGYCLEIDTTGTINATSPEGTHSVELDCDNGTGSKGNSSISTKVYLSPGSYELRYNYRSRVDYPNYDPAYICGSTANDVAFATDTTAPALSGSPLRTNQINTYLDLANTPAVPLHTTADGMQHLGGTNLVDTCVYSPSWIERSIRISVTTPAYYWLSFAADGTSDSFGGQLDNLRLCQTICPGSPQDNFPATWAAANNGGTNKVLFEDTFESPVYAQDTSPSHYIAKDGNVSLSKGTSGTSASGWPSRAASGWAAAPFNQITYAVNGAYQGTQYIALDGYDDDSSHPRNRSVSRSFLLDPGYYRVSYDYVSMVDFGPAITGTNCYAAPGSGQVFGLLTDYPGTIRYFTSTTANMDTNIIGVFMSNGQLVSNPGATAAQGSATPFTNPDGSSASYPTLPSAPPDGINYQSYDATQVNPLLDVCGYADSYKWVPRSVYVKITKPGLYWLTFSSNDGTGDATHTGDGNGGGIDDVKLTAIGSPYMSGAPTNALTTIPVPSPQPDSSYNNLGAFNGFYIGADPFVPPAAAP